MNRHEFQVHYSEAQIRRTSWAYFRMMLRRVMNESGWLFLGMVVVVWLFLLLTGGVGMVFWVVPAMIGSFVLFLLTAWQAHIRHGLERLSRMKSPVVSVVADEETLSIRSDLGATVMPWTAFTDWVDGPDAIYLQAGKGSMINLPTDGVDARALQFIRERIAASQPKT